VTEIEHTVANLIRRMDEMRLEIAALRRELNAQQNPSATDEGRIVLARRTTLGSNTFNEQIVYDGAFEDADSVRGAHADDDADPAAIMAPDADMLLLASVPSIEDGVPTRKFVEIDGGARVVCVRNATGANGTASTAATWVYDLYDITNTTLLASAVSLNADRPNGKLTAKADGSYASAKQIDGAWVLLGFWNCEPEVTGTATC
jgi:hypothetical protein